jgi:cellulose synthase/poly-beta-1,6-N-acetylglucosamine synthase-like glycosyltransferase
LNRDLKWTGAALVATLSAAALTLAGLAAAIARGDAHPVVATVVVLVLCGLTLSSMGYLAARWGRLRRQGDFRGVESRCPDRLYTRRNVPHVCVLVPSYQEASQRVRQAVISAALAEYPSRRIVVLIDDDPYASGAEADALAATQHAIQGLDLQFRHAARGLKAERAAFLARSNRGRTIDVAQEVRRLTRLYEQLAAWVEALAERGGEPAFAHVERFFNEQIVGHAADVHRDRADDLANAEQVDAGRVLIEYRRLALLLDVEIATFERKRYVNLTHAHGKAMNLNAYMGLLGRSFRLEPSAAGPMLQACTSGEADLAVPRADFVLALDADSVVRHDYLHKLASILLSDKRIAVAQTPSSCHPDAPTLLQRVAGAQTDVQFLAHQGLSTFRAAHWVGTNALLRVDALRDIQRIARERGHEVPVFIRDKSGVEHIGASIDLMRRGWRLHNHPERLAYSAAPRDFGALLMQRRRLASASLIALAGLLRHARRSRNKRPGAAELLMRAHVLCAPTLSCLALLVLALPLQGQLASPWLLLTALPCGLMYGWELQRCGHGWRDALRVYALNLMLVPVHGAGVLRSLQRIGRGRRSPFERAPRAHTRLPAMQVALQLGWLAATVAVALWALQRSHGWLGAFCLFNAACLLYGLIRFVGLRDAWQALTAVVPARRHALRQRTADAAAPAEVALS